MTALYAPFLSTKTHPGHSSETGQIHQLLGLTGRPNLGRRKSAYRHTVPVVKEGQILLISRIRSAPQQIADGIVVNLQIRQMDPGLPLLGGLGLLEQIVDGAGDDAVGFREGQVGGGSGQLGRRGRTVLLRRDRRRSAVHGVRLAAGCLPVRDDGGVVPPEDVALDGISDGQVVHCPLARFGGEDGIVIELLGDGRRWGGFAAAAGSSVGGIVDMDIPTGQQTGRCRCR
jgi:hypothetical protein